MLVLINLNTSVSGVIPGSFSYYRAFQGQPRKLLRILHHTLPCWHEWFGIWRTSWMCRNIQQELIRLSPSSLCLSAPPPIHRQKVSSWARRPDQWLVFSSSLSQICMCVNRGGSIINIINHGNETLDQSFCLNRCIYMYIFLTILLHKSNLYKINQILQTIIYKYALTPNSISVVRIANSLI